MLHKFIFVIILLTSACPALLADLIFEPQLARDIVFPDTPVGRTNDLNYTVTSRANGPWNVRLNSNNQVFSPEPNQFVVRDGQPVRFALHFSPRETGVVQGLLSGSYDNGDGLARINSTMSGEGVDEGARMELDAELIDFAVYVDEVGEVWTYTEFTLTVLNTGDEDLDIASITDPVNWLVCNRNALTIEPGSFAEIVFSISEESWRALSPDFYETTVTINSNDNTNPRLQIPVEFDRGLIPHYLVVLGEDLPSSEHIILVDAATINGDELDLWDEVGVFTPRGELAGSGALEEDWPLAMLAWGNDPNAGFAGFRENEEFDFRLWDSSAETEYAANAQFIEGMEQFVPDGYSEVVLSAVPGIIEREIALRQGWRAISLNISPEDNYWQRDEGPDIERLFSQVVGNTQMVKDGVGQFYLPERNFINIPYLNLQRGLLVRMAQSDTLQIRGEIIPQDSEITLSRGWNLVAYYPTVSMRMDAAFTGLVEQSVLSIVKDEFGHFFIPDYNFGGANTLNPNCAALIKVSEDCSFHYPANNNFVAGIDDADDDSTVHFPQPEPTDGNMSVLITSLDGIALRRGAEIACLTPTGSIAGAVRLSGNAPWGMAVWGDDSYTQDIVEGFRANEPLRFSYYDGHHEWEWVVEFDVIDGGEAVYSLNNLLVIGVHVDIEAKSVESPLEFALNAPYPNPFNSSTTISFSLPEAGQVRLSLIDLSGREHLTVASGLFEAGVFSRSIDASVLPAGIYLAVLEAGGKRLSQRVVVLK